jgi:hypothetical protein
MNPPKSLHGSHLRAYEKLFQHPLSHNVGWHEVLKMMSELGQVTDQPNGHIEIVRNGHSFVLHRPHTKDITDPREVLELRHFLERSETPLTPADPLHTVLVVISHHDARIFHSDANGTPAEPVRSHHSRYFGHRAGSKDFSRGMENPAPGSFFEPLALALNDASKILLFGSSAGNAGEMQGFRMWLDKHYPQVAARIVGSAVVDEHHMSDGELLAKARNFQPEVPPALAVAP